MKANLCSCLLAGSSGISVSTPLPPVNHAQTEDNEIPVYYNWQSKVFSLSPPLDMSTFLVVIVSILTGFTDFWQNSLLKDKPIDTSELLKETEKIEAVLKSKNDGKMPAIPSTLEK